jgi:WD40-like Beta Propeller Repeat
MHHRGRGISAFGFVALAALTALACGSAASKPNARGVGGGYSPYWADGGRLIAYERSSSGWGVMDSDGSNRRAVSDSELATLSPSGERVAEVLTPAPSGGIRLVLRSLAGGHIRSYRLRYADDYGPPVWAPAERAVALDSDKGILVADDRHPAARLIGLGGSWPAWSPDGRHIAFLRGSSLMVMRRDGTGLTTVAQRTAPPSTLSPWAPWSSDGRRLLFARDSAIYVVRPDGSDLRRVATAHARQLVWSPDDRRIAYLSSEGIAVVGIRGGSTRVITANKAQDGISWAPAEGLVYSRRDVVYTLLPGAHDGRIITPKPEAGPRIIPVPGSPGYCGSATLVGGPSSLKATEIDVVVLPGHVSCRLAREVVRYAWSHNQDSGLAGTVGPPGWECQANSIGRAPERLDVTFACVRDKSDHAEVAVNPRKPTY